MRQGSYTNVAHNRVKTIKPKLHPFRESPRNQSDNDRKHELKQHVCLMGNLYAVKGLIKPNAS
jgi:hypothetical protein